MERIPITFDYQGKAYSGHFSEVTGSGSSGRWHLIIDGYYYGQLFNTDNFGWQFGENFKEMAEYFGEYIVAWYESTIIPDQ